MGNSSSTPPMFGIVLDVFPDMIVIYTDQDRKLHRVRGHQNTKIDTLVWFRPNRIELTNNVGFSPAICTNCRYRIGDELVSGRCNSCRSDQEIGSMSKCLSCAVMQNCCAYCQKQVSGKIIPYSKKQNDIDSAPFRMKMRAVIASLKELK